MLVSAFFFCKFLFEYILSIYRLQICYIFLFLFAVVHICSCLSFVLFVACCIRFLKRFCCLLLIDLGGDWGSVGIVSFFGSDS